jgi:pilus assembly protein CpaF
MQDIFKFEQDGVNARGQAYGRLVSTGVRPGFLDRLSASGSEVDSDWFIARDLMVDEV